MLKIYMLSFVFFFLMSCDPDGKKQCEWYLIPEPSLKEKVSPGFIPVCARNFKTNKQDCRMQIKLDLAKKYYNRKFRYTDLEVESLALPRTIKKISFCE